MSNSFIHESSVINEGAIIGDECYIGPFCCIGSDVVLGNGVKLESHVVVTGDTVIGDNSVVYPFASLGHSPQDLKFKNEKSKLRIGKNTTIRENVTASIGTEGGGMLTKIGDNCLIMAYCHIAHDCIIGDNVVLTNGVNLSGHVVIENCAIIGGMSAVKQFTRIGKHSMIGGCTGVDRDVIPYGLVRGDRNAALKGLNIVGLKRNGMSVGEIKELLIAFREIFENQVDKELTIREKCILLKHKYRENERVLDIIDFVGADSKNPICTTVPPDAE